MRASPASSSTQHVSNDRLRAFKPTRDTQCWKKPRCPNNLRAYGICPQVLSHMSPMGCGSASQATNNTPRLLVRDDSVRTKVCTERGESNTSHRPCRFIRTVLAAKHKDNRRGLRAVLPLAEQTTCNVACHTHTHTRGKTGGKRCPRKRRWRLMSLRFRHMGVARAGVATCAARAGAASVPRRHARWHRRHATRRGHGTQHDVRCR